MRATKFRIRRFAFLLFVLVCSASMSLYWSRYIDAVRATLASSPGLKPKALSDLYPSWYAPRELLLHHRDPYGAQVNRELQIAYYGKELDPSRPEERRDQQRFVYPLYLIFLVGPLVWMPFHTARVVFFWSLAACAALNVVLWLRFLRMRLSWPAIAALFALVMTSIPVLQNLTILQPFLLPACFIAGTAAAVVSRRLFLAGALLAVATVKPQICVLLIAWLALWVCSDWKRRRPLLWGFTSVLAALILASAWLLPGWLIGYPNVLIAYAGYTNARSFLEVLLPSPLHWLVAILALATAAGFCWRARHEPADSAAFAIALSFALTLTVSIVPTVTQPFNHILLLPAVLLAIRYWGELRNRTPLTRFATSVFCLSAFLPWLFAVVAISRPLTPNSDWLLKIWSVPLASSMALPFAAFGVLILLRRAVPWQPTSRPLPPGDLAACMAKNKEQAARG